MMVTVMNIHLCRKYEVASKCVSYLLYICSDIKAKYKSKLDEFEYACSHFTIKDSMYTYVHYNLYGETEYFKKYIQSLCILNFDIAVCGYLMSML